MIKKAYLFCTSGNETKERSFTIKGNNPKLDGRVSEFGLKSKSKLSNEMAYKYLNCILDWCDFLDWWDFLDDWMIKLMVVIMI